MWLKKTMANTNDTAISCTNTASRHGLVRAGGGASAARETAAGRVSPMNRYTTAA